MKRVKGIWISGYESVDKLKVYINSIGLDFSSGELHKVADRYSWMCRVPADSLSLKKIAKKYIFSDLIEYSESDLKQAELLRIDVPGLARGETGPEFGNEYDFSLACDYCLSGAVLIPPFRVRAGDLPKNRPVACTHNSEFLVAGSIADEMAELESSSDWLVDVEDAKTRAILPWKAIQPKVVLPLMDPRTKGLEHETGKNDPDAACILCARDCYSTTYKTAFEPVYLRHSLCEASESFASYPRRVPDASRTYELFGPGRRPNSVHGQIAQPMIMVSQRVAQILLRYASKWTQLTPVSIV